MSSGYITVFFLNNDGSGYSSATPVREGTTVRQLFQEKMGAGTPASKYIIRCNNREVEGGQVLRDGDTVTVTPSKIAGARG